MKKIYIYIGACVFVGILMMFRSSIRLLLMENLKTPTPVDIAWSLPKVNFHQQKILLELHHSNPANPREMIIKKLSELREKGYGIQTLVLSGFPKIKTNTYIREISQEDWGIEEIRLHGTAGINVYAFINLVKSAFCLKQIKIWNNSWDLGALEKIRSVHPIGTTLTIIEN